MFNARTHRDSFYLLRKRLSRWQSCSRNGSLNAAIGIFPRKDCYKTICADMEARLLSGVRDELLSNTRRYFLTVVDFSIVFAIAVLQPYVAVSEKELLTVRYAIKNQCIP